jgi:hypothetical protein
MIQLGISRENQKKNIGTTIVALLIEIYAARIFPKNPFIYFPLITPQNLYDKVIPPTNKICDKLNFAIDPISGLYKRLCKIPSPKNQDTLLNIKLSYYYEFTEGYKVRKIEQHEISGIFGAHFAQKKITSFVHLSLGEYQDSDYYYSTGIRSTIDFINQGCELKNVLKMDLSIYFRTNLYEKLKGRYPIIAENNYCRPMSIFPSEKELISYCGDNKVMFSINTYKTNNIVGNIKELLQKYKYSELLQYPYVRIIRPPFLIDNKLTFLHSFFIIYKSGGIVRSYFSNHVVVVSKNTEDSKSTEDKDKITHYIYPDDIRKFDEKMQAQIDMKLFHETIDAGVDLLISEQITLYENQYAGFKLFSIMTSIDAAANGKLSKPSIMEIFNSKASYDSHSVLQYTNNIIFPHFGIDLPKFANIDMVPYIYKTHNSSDGILSPHYDAVRNLFIKINGKHFDIYLYLALNNALSKIGKIEITVLHSEIEIKHIFLEEQYRKKGYSTAAIALLMEILAARHAPINPLITIAKLEKIAVSLHFYKNNKNIFERLCRIIYTL